MDSKMKPTSQSIPSLMSVDFEPAAALSSNHFEPNKLKNGLTNGDLNGKKKSSFKVTFPDRLATERNSTQKKPHKSNLCSLFSKFDQERSLKGVKRKNLFGSRLDDNSSSDMPSHCTNIKNCVDLAKKFKKYHDLTKIDENSQHHYVTYGAEYLSKLNRHSITSSMIEKFDKKFKQIALSDDLINLPSISESFSLSLKHNSKLAFQRSKNYHLSNLSKKKNEKTNGFNVNSLNIFEENSEIANSILPELKSLITKNARLDDCQNFFDSIDIDNILGATDMPADQSRRAEPEKLCSLIETDVRYQHYMFKMVNLILNSLQKIYNLNLQQIKYLISNYQSRQMAENLSSTRQMLLSNECNALSQKLNILIEDYAKLNFDSTTETNGLVNLGAVIYKYLLSQLNQYLGKNEQKNFNYLRELMDYYEVIKIEYDKFCIYDLNFQLGSSISEHQTSNLMTYLNDFKIFLDDVLSEFLLVGKLEAAIQSKIKFILQIQTAFVGDDFNESLADPRKRDIKCCTELKKLIFNPLHKNLPIPSFNQKLFKKFKYRFKADFYLLDSRMWSKERERLESQEVVYFEDASELSIDEHEMNQLLGSSLVENDAQMMMDEPKSDSPSHSLPKTPVFKTNISVFSDGFSFLEPSIHNFEDIQSVPITPALNQNFDCLITKNFSEEFNEMNNEYDLVQEISQFVIKPLMDNIEKMFVKNSRF